jgi:hypothetical protein
VVRAAARLAAGRWQAELAPLAVGRATVTITVADEGRLTNSVSFAVGVILPGPGATNPPVPPNPPGAPTDDLDAVLQRLLVRYGILKPTDSYITSGEARAEKALPATSEVLAQDLAEAGRLQTAYRDGGWLEQKRRAELLSKLRKRLEKEMERLKDHNRKPTPSDSNNDLM